MVSGRRLVLHSGLGSFLLINQLMPHRSTENRSKKIRWSVDLRWQRPGERSGFEGIKDPILMRSAANGFRFEWGRWLSQNRITDALLEKKADPLDSSVTGPWLRRWER